MRYVKKREHVESEGEQRDEDDVLEQTPDRVVDFMEEAGILSHAICAAQIDASLRLLRCNPMLMEGL